MCLRFQARYPVRFHELNFIEMVGVRASRCLEKLEGHKKLMRYERSSVNQIRKAARIKKHNKTNPKSLSWHFVWLSHDKRFYRQPAGRAKVTRYYHPCRCSVARLFSRARPFLIALLPHLLDTACPAAKLPRVWCSILVVKTTRNMHTGLFSK